MTLLEKQPFLAVSVTGEVVELTDDLFEKVKNKIPNITREEASAFLAKACQNGIDSYADLSLTEQDRICQKAKTAFNRIFRCPKSYTWVNSKYHKPLKPEKNKQYGGNINLFRFAYSPEIKRETMIPLASAYSDSVRDVFDKVDYETNIYAILNPSVAPGTHGAEQVFCYRNFVVDMDMHEFPAELALHMGLAAAELISQEANEGMFKGCEPNIIIATGRGVQIVWSILPLRGDWSISKTTWTTIANALCDFMTDWLKRHPQFALFDIDRMASTRPGGLIRVPGTCNQEVKEELGLEYAITRAFMPISRNEHKYSDLQKTLKPFIPVVETGREDAQKSAELDISDDLKDLYALNTEEHIRRNDKVMALIRKHYKDPDSERWHIPEGMRDKVLFVLGNMALKYMPVNQVMNKMYGLNEKCFVPALSKEEVQQYLSTSLCMGNPDGTLGYKFSDRYILEMLGLPERKIPIYRDFDKIKKIRKIEQAARAEKKRALKEEAFCLHKLGFTFQQIAEKLDVCRQTVSTWTKEITEELKDASAELVDNFVAAFMEKSAKTDKSQDVQTEAQPQDVGTASDEQCGSDSTSLPKPKTVIQNIFDRVRTFKAEVSDCYLKMEATKTLWRLIRMSDDKTMEEVSLVSRQKGLLGDLFRKARLARPDDNAIWKLDPLKIVPA